MYRTLFIISSYYQLVNAVSLAMAKEEMISDLILLKPGMEMYINFQKLIDKQIFAQIMNWHENAAIFYLTSKNRRNYFINNIKKMRALLGLKKLKKTLPNYGRVYDEIFVFYPDIVTRIISAALTTEKTQINFAEDGTFTYEFFKTSQSIFRIFVYRFWLGQDVKKECKAVYVHRPELINTGNKELEIKELPTELKKLNELFLAACKQTLKCENLFNAKVIMLDQNLEYEEVLTAQVQIARQINNIFTEGDFVVKLHPGTDKLQYPKNIQLNSIKIPFEIPMASMENLRDKVLVSIFSTACMNPKLMLDAEPVVIFTYKLVRLNKLDFFDEKYLDIIERFKNLYRHKSRVLIPDSVDELKQKLWEIKNGVFE